MDSRTSPILVTFFPGVSPRKVKRSTVKILTRNISKTAKDMRFEPMDHSYVGHTGFRLAPSDLTLDNLEGLKINARGQKSRSNFLTLNMSRTATVTMLDP